MTIDTAPAGAVENGRRRSPWRAAAADYVGMALALAALVLVFSLVTRHFFSLTTFQTIANQIPSAIVVATGMTMILIIAEIDLSVGSVLGLCSAFIGVAWFSGNGHCGLSCLAQRSWAPFAAPLTA